MPLNDRQIIALKPRDTAYKRADGGGLSIRVTVSGSKLWRLAYRFGGKQLEMALGAYPEVTLAKAREERLKAKELLASGIDPIQDAKRRAAEQAAESRNTFGAIANDLIAKLEAEQKADATISKKRWFLSLVKAELAHRPIRDITAAEILAPLRRVEAQGNFESAKRLRAFIGQVFRYAIATARAENDPTFGLRGALVAPQVTHRAAITDKDAFAGLVQAIWQFEGCTPSTKAALQLMAILYPRPGELRVARWEEFDLEKAVWTIPASRTKMRREHRKPLSEAALAVLKQHRQYVGGEGLVLPSELKRHKPISENTINGALRRIGYGPDEMSAHGFRASASTLLNESGKWNPDAIEAELAHADTDQVRKAYHRATYWDERVKMADWWGVKIKEFADGAVYT